MPTYLYTCKSGHTTQRRAGVDVEVIPCPACGQDALRHSFYADCFLDLETGPKPVKQKTFGESNDAERRKKVALFREASAEVDYAYSKREKELGHPIQHPDYYHIGAKRAMERKGKDAGAKN